jgi:hypothetical protein
VFSRVHKPLVERAESIKHISSHKHAVKLQKLGRLPAERGFKVVEALILKEIFDVTDALPVFFTYVRKPACHVDDPVFEFALKVKRPDSSTVSLLGASNHRFEPAWRDKNIVVDEDDILCSRPLQPDVSRLIGEKVVIGANEFEPTTSGFFLELLFHLPRRIAVDIHQREWEVGVFVDASQRAYRKAESLSRHDNQCYDRNWHKEIWNLVRLKSASESTCVVFMSLSEEENTSVHLRQEAAQK